MSLTALAGMIFLSSARADVPGDFFDQPGSAAARPPLSSIQIQSLLPSQGKFISFLGLSHNPDITTSTGPAAFPGTSAAAAGPRRGGGIDPLLLVTAAAIGGLAFLRRHRIGSFLRKSRKARTENDNK